MTILMPKNSRRIHCQFCKEDSVLLVKKQFEGFRQVGELKKQGFLPDVKNVAVLTKDDTIGTGTINYLTSPDVKAMWEKDYGMKQVYAKQFAVATKDFTPFLREIEALPDKSAMAVSSPTKPR